MHPYVICRETEREVNEVRDYIIRHADQDTLEQEFQTYMGPQAITHSHRQPSGCARILSFSVRFRFLARRSK